MLSSIGGLIGILLGMLSSMAASRGLQVPFVLVPRTLLVAFLFSGAIGTSLASCRRSGRRASTPSKRCGTSSAAAVCRHEPPAPPFPR